MSSIELLAPAGSTRSVFPAIRTGADAIYLAGKRFGARGNADNFDKNELKQTVEYCHARNKKVYVTVNTLMRDDELQSALDFIEYAASLPIDAVIVQDVGLASLIRAAAPNLKIHGSTQMSIHTPAGAEALYDAGFSRVVLSRELSLSEIKEIAEKCPIELEVFVHGALCMSVSGQCYFSAMLGGRSGNRGLCAQPCRLPFAAPNGTGHDLSLKDLSIISNLKELDKIGVTSAKIEGRMKRPEYVAAAVTACRKALDGSLETSDVKLLESVFARSGFTDGYFTANRGKSMFGIRSKEDVVSATDEVFAQIHALYKDERQNIKTNFSLQIKKDTPILLSACDEFGHSSVATGDVPSVAINIPISDERCRAQLEKTGGTQFICQSVICDIDDGLSIPISALNKLRRAVLEDLEKQIANKKAPEFSPVQLPDIQNHIVSSAPKIRARFPNTNVSECFKNCEFIYVPLFSKIENLERLVADGFNVAVEVPRGMFGHEQQIREQLKRIQGIGINDVWVANIGAVALAQELDMKIHGGFGLNIMNTAGLEWAEDNGLADTEISFEMTLEQISKLGGNIKRGIVAYGRLPLMLTRNCPIANSESGCLSCKTPKSITDRKGVKFPVMCNFGCSEILNSVPLYLADRLHETKNIDFIVLRFSVENSVETEEKLHCFLKKQKSDEKFTRGLYYRGVE